MEWLNTFGLAFIIAIMIPNIIFAVKQRGAFENKYQNRTVAVIEQVGRYGCFAFMILNLPLARQGQPLGGALALYLTVNTALTVLYCGIWILFFRKKGIFKALSLSIIPSVLFLFSGILRGSVPLIISSLLFAPSHILISYKNAKHQNAGRMTLAAVGKTRSADTSDNRETTQGVTK